MTLKFVDTCKLPTPWGMFDLHGFTGAPDGKEPVMLSFGEFPANGPVLARIHSECLTGDALFSLRCDCGAQLQAAMHKIALVGRGVIFYLRQEGRGIGLINKIRAYHLQDKGADTVEANERLGFGADLRDYSQVVPMCRHLGIDSLRLLTNNPRKLDALTGLGLNVIERVPLETGRNPHNQHYLDTKRGKLGHLFDRNKPPAETP